MDNMFWQDFHHAYPLTAREQYIRILRDYEIVRRSMQYDNPVEPAVHTRNPARGFLHMPEHFVVAMMDVGNLRWGACEFSVTASGDVHHFDLGNRHHSPALQATSAEEEPPAVRKMIGSDYSASRTEFAEDSTNDTGLPHALKANLESMSGQSLDDVRVHFGSDQPAQYHAHAYAQGSDIYLGPGQEQHLAHEAWHVIQQKEGRVKPTSEMGDISLNDDPHLEREADKEGERAGQ